VQVTDSETSNSFSRSFFGLSKLHINNFRIFANGRIFKSTPSIYSIFGFLRSQISFSALRKIIKKHAKKTGIDLASDWMPRIENAPFHEKSTMPQLSSEIGLSKQSSWSHLSRIISRLVAAVFTN
jgi:hypothetical protein